MANTNMRVQTNLDSEPVLGHDTVSVFLGDSGYK